MKAYKGGVYTPNKWECENKIIGTHAMNIVGYGTWNKTNEKYWIVKNSWGQVRSLRHTLFEFFIQGSRLLRNTDHKRLNSCIVMRLALKEIAI